MWSGDRGTFSLVAGRRRRPATASATLAGSGDEVGPVGDPEALLADMDQVHGLLEPTSLERAELAEGDDVVG
jgi:hypothetical protein